jgi:hypothetical protein
MNPLARLLILWTRPDHLSPEEAEAWARDELAALRAPDIVERAELMRLRSASLRYPREGDWMLELQLARGADGAALLETGPWAEWLTDLRLLGMRPSVMLADGEPVLGGASA